MYCLFIIFDNIVGFCYIGGRLDNWIAVLIECFFFIEFFIIKLFVEVFF